MLSPATELRILGISGSGRKGSYNTALLKAAQKFVPVSVVLGTFDVSGFPLYNEDLERRIPTSVKEFKRRIREADAILFATPEYNYSVSAVLKNAIEWGNRPDSDNSWNGKPVAIMSASASPRGGARAQMALRQIMVDLNMHPINEPQLLLSKAEEKFDQSLQLNDERSQELLQNLLKALIDWVKILRPNQTAAQSRVP